MSDIDHPFPTSLAGMLGRSQLNEAELADLRLRAWQEQGLLIVDPWDHRLSSEETLILLRLGGLLYGKRGER